MVHSRLSRIHHWNLAFVLPWHTGLLFPGVEEIGVVSNVCGEEVTAFFTLLSLGNVTWRLWTTVRTVPELISYEAINVALLFCICILALVVVHANCIFCAAVYFDTLSHK